MSSIIGRAAFRATPRLRDAGLQAGKSSQSMWKKAVQASDDAGGKAIRQGAKRDPELYPLYLITAAVFAWAGYRFIQSPTGSDYSGVATVDNSKPWEQNGSDGKFKYYVRGDPKQGVKDHPSALNTVIVPNVTLPAELHEKYNKFGKEEYDF